MVRVVFFSFIGVRVGVTSTTSSSLPSLSYGQGLRLKPPTQDGEGRGLKKRKGRGMGDLGRPGALATGPCATLTSSRNPTVLIKSRIGSGCLTTCGCFFDAIFASFLFFRDNIMFNAASSAWRVSCCVTTASRSGAAVCPTADLSDGAVCSTISISGADVCPTAPAGGGYVPTASRRGGYVSLASPSGGWYGA